MMDRGNFVSLDVIVRRSFLFVKICLVLFGLEEMEGCIGVVVPTPQWSSD